MRSRWLLLFGVWLLYGCFGLVVTSLAPMASLIISDLNMTHAQMGLAMGAWQLVYIFSAVPAGMLLDRIGARSALTVGALLIALSAFARIFADDATGLVIAVMIFGLGGPIVSAGAPKVVVTNFSGSSRGLAMGIYMTGPAIGGIVSLTMTQSLLLPVLDNSWQNVMTLWAALTVAAAAVWLMISTLTQSSADLAAPEKGLSQLTVIKDLITKPAVVIVLAMSVSVFMFNHGLSNWLPELLISHGYSAVNAGYLAAIPTVIGIIGSLLIPRLATPERRFNILIALAATAVIASLLLRFSEPSTLISGLLMQGIARSSLMTVLILTLVELPEIGERYAGVASGLFFSAAEVGGVLGPLTLGLLYDPASGFSSGLTLITLIAISVVVGALVLKQRTRHQRAAT